MLWLYLAVLAPFIISFTNIFDKFLIEKKVKHTSTVPIFSGIVSLIFGILIFVFHGLVILPLLQGGVLLISGVFIILYLIPYFKALAIDDSSRVVPLFQFVPIFVLLLSYVLLREQLTTFQLIAFIFIITGGFLLGMEKSDVSFLKPRKSLLLMLLSSLMVSFAIVLFKYAYVTGDFFTTIAYQSLGSGLGVFFLLLKPSIYRSFLSEVRSFQKNVLYILFLNKGLEFIGEAISFMAITLAPVALVTVFGGLQSFFVLAEAIILSLWFPHIIKERITKTIIVQKIISISLIFIGIYFLSG